MSFALTGIAKILGKVVNSKIVATSLQYHKTISLSLETMQQLRQKKQGTVQSKTSQQIHSKTVAKLKRYLLIIRPEF